MEILFELWIPIKMAARVRAEDGEGPQISFTTPEGAGLARRLPAESSQRDPFLPPPPSKGEVQKNEQKRPPEKNPGLSWPIDIILPKGANGGRGCWLASHLLAGHPPPSLG